MKQIPRAVVAVIATLLVGCGTSSRASGDKVSPQDARQLVETAVQATLDGKYSTLCDLAASKPRCERELGSSLKERTPKGPPTVACMYQLFDKRNWWGRTVVTGGQVLVVQGMDGQGHPFETEVLVFHDGKQLVAQNIIWWSGMGIAEKEPGKSVTTGSGAAPPQAGKCQ